MHADREILAEIAFEATVIHWRGPSPYFFVAVPDEHVGEVQFAARLASYGWGVVPVSASIGAVAFETSLFPKDSGYLLPLKVAVRKRAKIALGNDIAVTLRIYPRRGGPALY